MPEHCKHCVFHDLPSKCFRPKLADSRNKQTSFNYPNSNPIVITNIVLAKCKLLNARILFNKDK